MASRTLYPAVVDSYVPAFKVNKTSGHSGGEQNFYFSLSKYNGSSDFDCIQVAINKQDTGLNVVNKEDSNERYRCAGYILDVPAVSVTVDGVIKDNLYCFTLSNADIATEANGYHGQVPGYIYKIQIRLVESGQTYSEKGQGSQSDYLNVNADHFSEQSTICVAKSIGNIDVVMPIFDNESEISGIAEDESVIKSFSSLDLFGQITSEDPTEVLYKYNFKLYNENNVLLEDSGDILANKYQNINEFRYLFKTEFKHNNGYRIDFTYVTNNEYTGTTSKSFECSLSEFDPFDQKLATVDGKEQNEHQHNGSAPYNSPGYHDGVTLEVDDTLLFLRARNLIDVEGTRLNFRETPYVNVDNTQLEVLGNLVHSVDYVKYLVENETVDKEEEEGRIGLKIVPATSEGEKEFFGNMCIRRSSSKDNFNIQEDIIIIPFNGSRPIDYPLINDYSAESGVFYQYGLQRIDIDGTRSKLNIMDNPVMRNYEHSYLLGENNKQLKIKFNTVISSFKYQILDAKTETIGGKYPVIARNAAVKYRTFPISGTISFMGDENDTFYSRLDAYKNNKEYYEKYNESNNITQYDYIYERAFRDEVYKFLYDGKPKLFKSPTEGNIIVRLTDISFTPNKSLDRLIYDFTCTASEIAEDTIDNYKKYYFIDPGEPSEDTSKVDTFIGQLQMEFTPDTNIFEEIYKKYDSQGNNQAGMSKKLKGIHHIKITFDEESKKVYPNNDPNKGYTMGYNFKLDKKYFTVYAPQNTYTFDERFTYSGRDNELYLLADAGNYRVNTNATIDFLYDIATEKYHDKQISTKNIVKGVGQIFDTYQKDTSLYYIIYDKYHIDTEDQYRKITGITSFEIEAPVNAAFQLIDEGDDQKKELHIMNETGVLSFEGISGLNNLIYAGMYNQDTGELLDIPADILIEYRYELMHGYYKKES